MVIFFEKTMKASFKTVMLSLKIYENILKFNLLMGDIRHIDYFHRFIKRSFIAIKNNEVLVNL